MKSAYKLTDKRKSYFSDFLSQYDQTPPSSEIQLKNIAMVEDQIGSLLSSCFAPRGVIQKFYINHETRGFQWLWREHHCKTVDLSQPIDWSDARICAWHFFFTIKNFAEIHAYYEERSTQRLWLLRVIENFIFRNLVTPMRLKIHGAIEEIARTRME